MSRSVLIQVAEWDRVDLPSELDTPRWRERLLLTGRSDRGDALRLRGRTLYARDRVGILDAGPVRLQIVPKIHDESTPLQDASHLLRMMLIAGFPIRADVRPGHTAIDRASIAEPILRVMSQQLHQLIVQGVPRRYKEREEWAETIRGRIDMGRLARRRPGLEHRIPVRYAPLQRDNRLSRLVKALARTLAHATRSARTEELLRRCESILADADDVVLMPSTAEGVQLSRLESEWAWVVELARQLATGRSPDPVSPGAVGGFTILFGVDDLFEHVVRRALVNGLRGSGVVLSGRPERFLLRTQDGEELLELRPDLLFYDRDDPTVPLHVADAKWKRFRPERPDLGLSAPDLYQITTYIRRFGVDGGWLVFPSSDPIADGDPFRVHPLELLPDLGALEVVEVDVARLLEEDEEERRDAEERLATYALGACRPAAKAI